ncbi:MAG: sulfite exporter TauE/SafE family protein [Nocardioidaceae bacterium]
MAGAIWALPVGSAVAVGLVVVLGGLVRGFGGFGASMVWVAGMSLFVAPAAVVPTVLILEVLASAQLLPGVWRQVHWQSLRWLLVGVLAGLPFGMWALVSVPDRPLRLAIAVAVGLAAVLMATGAGRPALPGPSGTVAVGSVSGVLNGAFAMGGPPAILMYFSSPQQAAVGRASLIAFFLCTDVLGIAAASVAGLVDRSVVAQSLALWPVALITVAAGAVLQRRTDDATLRRVVLWLLVPLACLLAVDAWLS